MKQALLLPFLALSAVGCAAKPVYLNRDIYKVVVLPPFNETPDTDASKDFWPYVRDGLAAHGYQVVDPSAVAAFYEKNKFRGDAAEINLYKAEELAKEFKADAVFYSNITKWGYKYLVIYSEYGVAAEFALTDGKSGERVWQGEGSATETSGGLSAEAIVGTIGNAFLNNKGHFCAASVREGLRKLPLPGHEPKPEAEKPPAEPVPNK